jgi:2-dehydro-3-deoxyphosphogluconate aldolase/(4S)-4-hydroxy-2-oxoglutarate aldolase
MTREQVIARIQEIGIIPGIRVSSADDALFAVEAICSKGIPIVEITMTVPGAVEIIAEVASKYPDAVVGGGTVWDVEMARQCIDAGAGFVTSPGLNVAIVEFARKSGVVAIPGALTPTEIMQAWQAGADFVKIFPCTPMGGPSYIKALRAPFPDVRLIAAGGVNQSTAADFILAGASAVGIGRDLVQPAAIQRRERSWIRELSGRFVNIVQQARREY